MPFDPSGQSTATNPPTSSHGAIDGKDDTEGDPKTGVTATKTGSSANG